MEVLNMTNVKTLAENLISYIETLRPVIWIRHEHYPDVEEILTEVKKELNTRVFTFDLARGLVDSRGGRGSIQDALEVIRIVEMEERGLLVLRDAHVVLKDERVIAAIRYVAERTLRGETFEVTTVLLAPRVQIPVELEHLTTVFEFPQPNDENLRDLVQSFAREQEFSVDSRTEDTMVAACRGLRKLDVQQILRKAYHLHGTLGKGSQQIVQEEKEHVLRKNGKIELIKTDVSIKDLGGLENLKIWLNKKKKIFDRMEEAKQAGVDSPRGMLIVGMPGCGKSIAAKATAVEFGVPLLRLDIGRLMGKYVGESEENLSQALRIAEGMSPCVLWIDELEKAFAGVGQEDGGGSVTTRLFGHFLTWMQERTRPVFIVATANNVSGLPREFSRKGRFDEIFAVELPGPRERHSILEIHLRKRKCTIKNLDLDELADITQDFNGADIEALVKEAVEQAFLGDRAVTTKSLSQIAKKMNGFASIHIQEIRDLRTQLAKLGARPAGNQD
jgi:ATP-dependent 26S proteasome regulatory subunit